MSKSRAVVFCPGSDACEFSLACSLNGDYVRIASKQIVCRHTPAIVKALKEQIEALTVEQLKEDGLNLSRAYTCSFVEGRIAALGFPFKWTLGIDRKLIISFLEVDSDPEKLEQDAVKIFSDIPTIRVVVDSIQLKTLGG